MKKIFSILLFLTVYVGFSKSASETEINEDFSRDSIVNYAMQFLDTPYLYGGSTPSGFDCSGFVYYVFKQFGIQLSRASKSYENIGETVDLSLVMPADIMAFTGTDASIRKIGHIGIVLRRDGEFVDFIHSSSSKKHFGVVITRYNQSGYEKRFLKAIRVLDI